METQMSATHCYMCEAAATSVEHVPPRCLFPEQKDLPGGVDLRKELMTVPSCKDHNISKSKDDEYLLYALSMNIGNNQTGSDHLSTKICRAIKHNPSVIKKFRKKERPVQVEDSQTGEIYETLAVQVDEKRLRGALTMIGRALYFYHFKTSWRGSVSAYPFFYYLLVNRTLSK